MSLHNEIMNIPCKTLEMPSPATLAYKTGHKDARHAAAEQALKYELYIERLEDMLENPRILRELREECGL